MTTLNIPRDINLIEMYENQTKIFDSPEYKKYKDTLIKYFQEDPSKKYERVEVTDEKTQDTNYLLLSNKNVNKEILIHPSKFTNLYDYYLYANKKSNEILYKISEYVENKDNIQDEERSDFDLIKTEYVTLRKHLDEVNFIFNNQYNTVNELLDKKLKETIELSLLLQDRQDSYQRIGDKRITNIQKNQMAEEFKKNNLKIPDDFIIKKISKDIGDISFREVENWFNWIEKTYLYMKKQKELNLIDKDISSVLNKIETESKNLLFEIPFIQKKK